jgi:hypothetical protein
MTLQWCASSQGRTAGGRDIGRYRAWQNFPTEQRTNLGQIGANRHATAR